MAKEDLKNQLNNARNNFILGLAATRLFQTPEVYPILDKSYINFEPDQKETYFFKPGITVRPYSFEFKQTSDLLKVPEYRDIAISEFARGIIRALIKESYELVKNYCEESKQDAVFKAQPWYQFARMIRNPLSHNFKFQFNKYDKTLLPVYWNSLTIDISMDGNDLTLDFFSLTKTWELFLEFESFADKIT